MNWSPTDKMLIVTFELIKDPSVTFAILTMENLENFTMQISKNELLLTSYWMEQHQLIKRTNFVVSKKKYQITEQGESVYNELKTLVI